MNIIRIVLAFPFLAVALLLLIVGIAIGGPTVAQSAYDALKRRESTH